MVYNTFSKRQKAAETRDIYIYDDIPVPLRTQIVHIWHDAIGNEADYYATTGEGVRRTYKCLVEMVRNEVGVFILPPSVKHMRIEYLDELVEYFLHEKDVGRVLDVIEFSFRLINRHVRDFHYQFKQNSAEIADQAINDLNIRFEEHSVGYRFEDEQIIRIDSAFLHAEVVKPALKLLNKSEYAGAQNEFLNACEHYRHGRKKDVLDDCLKAFESIMKSICKKREWVYPSNATASPLIGICLNNKLIPPFFQSKVQSLQSLFESGIPTVRNKMSGHGQGDEIVDVPDYIVAYALHETAAILVLFDRAEANLK